ncbi:hypothetical protein CEXT_731201 [Caerostris extrusa]|uniref:Uncharacterized protein n=1 Tax=Caerostris extrusa TaxID=172846 RepID=A0AAV4VZL0_CAEEX|nr:hypothetical protein CEXT_731201 [Caerostris extrusa]
MDAVLREEECDMDEDTRRIREAEAALRSLSGDFEPDTEWTSLPECAEARKGVTSRNWSPALCISSLGKKNTPQGPLRAPQQPLQHQQPQPQTPISSPDTALVYPLPWMPTHELH